MELVQPAPVAEDVVQLAAVHELHDHVEVAAVLQALIQSEQVGVPWVGQLLHERHFLQRVLVDRPSVHRPAGAHVGLWRGPDAEGVTCPPHRPGPPGPARRDGARTILRIFKATFTPGPGSTWRAPST